MKILVKMFDFVVSTLPADGQAPPCIKQSADTVMTKFMSYIQDWYLLGYKWKRVYGIIYIYHLSDFKYITQHINESVFFS